jgi:hypothetical protein
VAAEPVRILNIIERERAHRWVRELRSDDGTIVTRVYLRSLPEKGSRIYNEPAAIYTRLAGGAA